MKKRTLLIILAVSIIVAVLPACGAKKQPADLNVEEIYAEISSNLNETMYADDGEYIFNYYGIDESLLNQYVFYEAEDGLKVETVAFIIVKDEADIDGVVSNLEMVKQQKMTTMDNYIPEQYEIASKGIVGKDGSFVYLIISENVDEIESIVKSYFE